MADLNTSPPANHARARFFAVLILLSVLVLANMVFIFMMSSEDSADSGDRSSEISDAVVDVVYPDLQDRPIEKQESIELSVDQFVRKLAHFAEFALLGFLTSALLLHLSKRLSALYIQRQWGCAGLFCLLYAVSDEAHQNFTKRVPSTEDVLIDFAGSLLGILLLHLIARGIKRHCIRKKMKKGATA